MKKIIITTSLILGFVTAGFSDDPPPFNPNNPDSIPIDGGILLLLGAGTGYGLKKVREQNSES